MALESIRYQNTLYYFDLNKPNFYFFDKENMCHIIIYTIRNKSGVGYTAEWKIPGTKNKDIEYAKRWTLRLSPINLTLF